LNEGKKIFPVGIILNAIFDKIWCKTLKGNSAHMCVHALADEEYGTWKIWKDKARVISCIYKYCECSTFWGGISRQVEVLSG